MMLIHPNKLPTDGDLAHYLAKIIEKEWLQLIIKQNGPTPEVKGTPNFNQETFIRDNWKDDTEKQGILLENL